MKISQVKKDKLQYAFKVEVPRKDLDTRVEARVLMLGKKAKIAGFRPGKAPLSILKQHYMSDALEHVLGVFAQEGVNKIVQDNNIRVVEQPKLDLEPLGTDKDVVFNVDLESYPTFSLKSFQDIQLERLAVKLTDDEISKRVAELCAAQVKFVPNETAGYAAQAGERVALEVHSAFLDDAPFKGLGTSMHLAVKTDQPVFCGKLEATLEGMKVGDTVDVTETFPDDFEVPDLRGKKMRVTGKITEIALPKTFEVGEEFAKEMGCESLEELRGKTQTTLMTEFNKLSRLHVKRYLLDALAEGYDFELPELLVQREFDNIWQRLQLELEKARREGSLEPEDDRPEEELRKEYTQIARRRVRLGLVVNEVARSQKIKVEEQELQQAVFHEAMRYPRQEDAVVQYYRNNPEALQQLSVTILEEKVVDFILTQAQVKEKQVSQDVFMQSISGVVPGYEAPTSKTTERGSQEKQKSKAAKKSSVKVADQDKVAAKTEKDSAASETPKKAASSKKAASETAQTSSGESKKPSSRKKTKGDIA